MKDEKHDTLGVIDNYNFYERHRHIYTYRHGDSMTEGQVGENHKIVSSWPDPG